MRAAYRQVDAGPVVNLARHPRGTLLGSVNGQWPKWQIDRWGGDGSYTLITGITGHPDGITTAFRLTITATARNNHGFHIAGNPEQTPPAIATQQMVPARPGERLTLSCWLRYTGSSTQRYRLRFRSSTPDGSAWIDGGVDAPLVTLPTGAWTKLSHTYTVPAGAGYVALYATNNTAISDAIGDMIDGTGLMLIKTSPAQGNSATDPYATKLTIPTGGWGWTPRWFGSTGNAGTTTQVAGASDGPDEIPTYLRKTWTTVAASVQDVAYTHTATGVRPVQGEVWAIGSYLRASKGWAVTQHCRLVISWFDGTGAQIGALVLGPNIPTVTANTWHRLSITATAPAGAVTMFAHQQVYVENGAWAAGDTIDGTGLMATRTPPRWGFADGNSPGWKWLGAVNTSESAGYPKP